MFLVRILTTQSDRSGSMNIYFLKHFQSSHLGGDNVGGWLVSHKKVEILTVILTAAESVLHSMLVIFRGE